MSVRMKRLQDRKAAIARRMDEMLAAAEADGREFTDAEGKDFAALEAECAEVQAGLDRESRLQEIERSMKPIRDVNEETPEERAALVGGTVRPAWIDDPRKGFKTSREFLMAVMQAGRTGRLEDERLRHLAAAGSDEARGNSDPAGGFLIPEGFAPNLLQLSPEADPMAGLTRDFPMARPIVRVPARVDKNHSTSVSGGLVVTRRPETVAGTASQMTFEQVAMEAHSLFGISYATEEILTDSPISFVAILTAGFADQFAAHLVNERLNGTGVGEYLGVLNSPCLVIVSKESGQSAGTILKENIDNMRSRCWGYDRAVWLANHDCLPALRSLVQVVGIGGNAVPYLTMEGANNDRAMLDGRPVIFTEFTKTVGTVGDLVLGNWQEYLEGTYQPLQSAESIHVRFVNHERTFKFWLRNAGQPWWKSALTPRNSAATLSPFVVLQTRS